MSNWSVFKTTTDKIGMGVHETAQQKWFESLQDMARERALGMIFNIKNGPLALSISILSMTHLVLCSRIGEFAVSDSVRIQGICTQSHLCLEIQNVSRRLVRKVNNRWLFVAESQLRFVESGPTCDAKMFFEGLWENWSCLIECVRGSRRHFWAFYGMGNRVRVTSGVLCNGESRDSDRGRAETQTFRHRFSAFWLRSKCSICSYQLNIWYVDHVSTSILIWFFQGEWLSEACFGSFTSWPGIAVPPGSAHFPIIQPIKAKQQANKLVQKSEWLLARLFALLVPVCIGIVHLADTRGLHRASKENVGQWDFFSNRRVKPSPTNCGLNL